MDVPADGVVLDRHVVDGARASDAAAAVPSAKRFPELTVRWCHRLRVRSRATLEKNVYFH